MPRSDDWTIHIGPALIKRGALADFPSMTRKRSNQSPFPSLCPASLNLTGAGFGGAVIQGLGVGNAARFFFAELASDQHAAPLRRPAGGQAIDMFVELTWTDGPAAARPLLP